MMDIVANADDSTDSPKYPFGIGRSACPAVLGLKVS